MSKEFYENIYLNVAPDKYPDEQYYGTAEYDGSYTFLQEVRVLLGDDIFMDFVRKYYEQFYMKIVKTEDVLKLLKEYNVGGIIVTDDTVYFSKNLEYIFKQSTFNYKYEFEY